MVESDPETRIGVSAAAGQKGSTAPPRLPAGPDERHRRQKKAPGRLAFWLYRTAAAVFFVLLLTVQARLMLVNRDMAGVTSRLETARATIEQAVTSGAEDLRQMHLVPPDGQAVPLGLKLSTCDVEEICFHGSDVTLRIANPGAAATRPFARVRLFDADGRQVGEGNVVEYRTDSLKPGEKRAVTDHVSSAGDAPRYFVVDEKR